MMAVHPHNEKGITLAGSSFLALFDDIAMLLDDIAVMSKVAVKKTAGVLGDDLALNAEQVSGVRAEREIPVVWAVAKGSFKNKLVLVPGALLISALIPWAITPLLMLGGAYLCFEGFEKIAHSLLHKEEILQHHQEQIQAIADPAVDMLSFEKNKIKGAIRTDFILSAEIVVIALGTVQAESLLNQALVVSTVALLITVGVYGLVAGIVKLDDAGLYLIKNSAESAMGKIKAALGKGLLIFAPFLMKTLSVVGTAAMFLVGGGILMHGIPAAHHLIESSAALMEGISYVGGVLAFITPSLINALAGILAGALLLVGVNGFTRIKKLLIK